MSVLIVIPTIDGREEFLFRCIDAYVDTLFGGRWKTYPIFNRSTCGEAWNEGAAYALANGYDYVHMTADDLIPHPGWYEAAVKTIDEDVGFLPGALVYNPDGSLPPYGNQRQSEWTILPGASVPFCRTEDWIDIPNIHYYSDNAYDYAQKKVNNYSFVARKDYAFTHYTAQEGRKSLSDAERIIFEEWKETL